MGKSSLHGWHSSPWHPYMSMAMVCLAANLHVVIAGGIAMWYTMHERRLRKDW